MLSKASLSLFPEQWQQTLKQPLAAMLEMEERQIRLSHFLSAEVSKYTPLFAFLLIIIYQICKYNWQKNQENI